MLSTEFVFSTVEINVAFEVNIEAKLQAVRTKNSKLVLFFFCFYEDPVTMEHLFALIADYQQ